MIQVYCDHCQQRIEDVAYEVRPVDADDPRRKVNHGRLLHGHCIGPWARRAFTLSAEIVEK